MGSLQESVSEFCNRREFRRAAHKAVPTITDLEKTIRRPGSQTDLVELTRDTSARRRWHAAAILPAMEVRPAAERDIPALMPLMRGYCDFYEANPTDAGLAEMATALIAAGDDQGMLLVAEDDDGEVIGFAAVGWKWSSLRGARIAVLEDLFVAREARGQGAADALIEACASRARTHGAPVMTWLTAPDNHRAQAVYNRVGGKSETFLEYELELR